MLILQGFDSMTLTPSYAPEVTDETNSGIECLVRAEEGKSRGSTQLFERTLCRPKLHKSRTQLETGQF